MPNAELTPEAKDGIRTYVFKLLVPPAVIVSILTFILGFAIQEGAAGRALADALKNITLYVFGGL